jgi:hypothetical protein
LFKENRYPALEIYLRLAEINFELVVQNVDTWISWVVIGFTDRCKELQNQDHSEKLLPHEDDFTGVSSEAE